MKGLIILNSHLLIMLQSSVIEDATIRRSCEAIMKNLSQQQIGKREKNLRERRNDNLLSAASGIVASYTEIAADKRLRNLKIYHLSFNPRFKFDVFLFVFLYSFPY